MFGATSRDKYYSPSRFLTFSFQSSIEKNMEIFLNNIHRLYNKIVHDETTSKWTIFLKNSPYIGSEPIVDSSIILKKQFCDQAYIKMKENNIHILVFT